ncbi:MAG TPA: nucleotidyltransferase domain-containing protein [Polyangia bacterium]|nr:nucleotidyltransferase domain-containing protein [Polyangia bacterium]
MRPPGILSEAARAVAEQVLAEEEARRRHLVVVLSGAHAYGFPSPDSDLDLKGLHVEPTRRLVGLEPPPLHANRLEVIQGVEIDYSSNEIGPALASLLGGNGTYLERVLGSIGLKAAAELGELQALIRRNLSRALYRHYHGFAEAQRRTFESAAEPTAKRLLYVLRTALTGTHLLRTGALVTDLTEIMDEYGFGAARALVEAKRTGERVVLGEATREAWRGELGRALALLDEARERSPLPEEAPARAEAEAWLIELRRRCF